MNIDKLIETLTLEEKCALLSGSTNWDTATIKRLGIPATNCADGPYGLRKEMPGLDKDVLAPSYPATCFPLSVTLASTWDVDIAEAVGRAIGEEAADQHVQTVLGPGVNIKRSPLCGRNFEYFSEDPFLAGKLAASFIRGVQQNGIGTSLKHFAVNNQEYRRMSISAEVGERALREIYLPAFEIAVKEAQPYTVMCSYNRINGVFASDNKYLLTDILRKEWGFEGIVISDWGAVNDRVAGVLAGLDLEMPSSNGTYDRIVQKAVETHKIMEDDVDLCVRRILGYVNKVTTNTAARIPQPCDYEAHHALARKAAAEGIVLLKNQPTQLPLSKAQKIAVVGSLAKTMRYRGGGSSQVNPRHLVSLTETLDREGIAYTYAQGYDGRKTNKDLLKEAVSIAQDSDVVLAFIGLTDDYESEGFDRKDLNLPASHNRLIMELAKVNPHIVVVLSLGAPVTMPWLDKVPAVLNLYLGGEAMGEAAYDVIFGDVSPSGKLAETFPYGLDDNPASQHFGGGPKTVEYRESIFVGYRYYDRAKKNVLFPFGHGLSYTSFEYSDLRFDTREVRDGKLHVEFTVENVGPVAGAEVAQLYVRDPVSIVFREDKALKGFVRVMLAPGEKRTVSFDLGPRAWAFYNVLTHDWAIETGEFDILVGASSRDIRLNGAVHVVSSDKQFPNDRLAEPAYFHLSKTEAYPQSEFETVIGRPLPDNHRFKRSTVDNNITLTDARRISLNGAILYHLFYKMARSFVPKDSSEEVRQLASVTAVGGPLRQLVSHTRGEVDVEGLQGLILIIKGRLIRGLHILLSAMRRNKKNPAKKAIY